MFSAAKTAATRATPFSKTLPKLTIPPYDHTPLKYTGPSYEDVLRMRKENVSSSTFMYYKQPVLLNEGNMQYLYDHTGKRYLDLFAGIATCGQGHCHPRITAKIQEQAAKLQHVSTIYLNDQMSLYAKELADKLPEGLDCIFFTTSGSEANAMAAQLVREYTGNYPILNLKNAYHGMGGTQMLTAINCWNHDIPRVNGIEPACFPDTFRGMKSGETVDMYVKQVQDTIFFNTAGKVAGFIAEPIQGGGGLHPMPEGFIPRAAEEVRKAGGLYISDEVQTGFGRLGSHYWGFEWLGVKPDMVTMAKQIGDGMPLGAIATTKEIANCLKKLTFHTYAANPLCMAAGREVLKVVDDEGMMQNCAERGEQMMKGLKELMGIHKQIGDVRGHGFMIGMEIVRDQESNEPVDPEFFADFFERTKDYGILLGKGGRFFNTIRIQPPMCVSEQDVDFALDVIDQSLKDANDARR